MDNTVTLWLFGGASVVGTGVVDVAGRQLSAWTSVRVTRGMERCPSDFELTMTSRFPGALKQYVVSRGDRCQVFIGDDLVITGWVDRVTPSFTRNSHSITVIGRSKCADLVDCSAEWPGGQIVGTSALDIATKVAAKYNIAVHGKVDEGQVIPSVALMYGESAFSIIERTCRYRQLLAYDDVYGNLVLSQVTKDDRMASGFVQGQNVESASAVWSMDERFSDYAITLQSINTFQEEGDAGFVQGIVNDDGVPRHRLIYLVAEASFGGLDLIGRRAQWECNRRYGRSNAVRLSCDSWRDQNGRLWTPNTLVPVKLPELSSSDFTLNGVEMVIGEVSFHQGDDGEHAELVLMPPQAFDPAPIAPPTNSDVPVNAGKR